MAITISSDLHSLDQVGQAAVDVAFSATPLLTVPGLVTDVRGRLNDAGGDTIVFPVWETDTTGQVQAANRTTLTGVTPTKVELDSYTETAVTKVISVAADRFAVNDASEGFLDHLAVLVGREFGKTVQASLITAAEGTDLSYDATEVGAGGLTVNSIMRARTMWGDHASELGSPVLLCSTTAFIGLAESEDYKSLASSGSTLVAGTDWIKAVGIVHGVPIYLCDSVSSTGTPAKYTNLLVAQEALGIYVADKPATERILTPGTAIATYDTYIRYAVTLWRNHPRRVVKLVSL